MVLMLAGIDDPKLDSTASHSSSLSHSLPHRVVCHPGHPASTTLCGLVLGPKASVHMLRLLPTVVIRWSAVCFGFGCGYGRK